MLDRSPADQIESQSTTSAIEPQTETKAFPTTQVALCHNIQQRLQQMPDDNPASVKDTSELTAEWHTICNCLKETSTETLGFCDKKHQDWFDDNE